MKFSFQDFVGAAAAICATLSYLPQVKKAWPKNSTDDVSLTTLIVLATGLLLWCLYGSLRNDMILVLSNAVGAALVLTVLVLKCRDLRSKN